jgi:hypothetical protein
VQESAQLSFWQGALLVGLLLAVIGLPVLLFVKIARSDRKWRRHILATGLPAVGNVLSVKRFSDGELTSWRVEVEFQRQTCEYFFRIAMTLSWR